MRDNAFVRVLSITAFRNLWLSQLFSQVFVNLLFFSLIIRVYELTRSNTAVALMVVTTILPNILIGALAGVLVDSWDRKAVMFFSHFLRALVVLLFLVSSETIVWIYILTTLVGVISQFFFPAEGATIPEVVKDRKLLLSANSLFTLTFFTSVVVGNVLAGPFLRLFGAHTTFLIVAGAFLIASVFTAKLPGLGVIKGFISSKKSGFPADLMHHFMEGLDYIYRNPIVRRGIYYMALGQGMIAILGGIAPGFADSILGLPAAEVSVYVMAPAAFGMIVGGLVVGQFFGGFNKIRLIKTGLFCSAVILMIFSQVDIIAGGIRIPAVGLAAFMLIVLGVSNSLLEIPVNTLIQENTPEQIRSRIYGVIGTMIGMAAILPIMGAGTFADLLGVRTVVLISGVVLSGFALYSLRPKHVSSYS